MFVSSLHEFPENCVYRASNISKGKAGGVHIKKKSLVCKTPIVKVDRNKNNCRGPPMEYIYTKDVFKWLRSA
jgi:hypothetical protein